MIRTLLIGILLAFASVAYADPGGASVPLFQSGYVLDIDSNSTRPAVLGGGDLKTSASINSQYTYSADTPARPHRAIGGHGFGCCSSAGAAITGPDHDYTYSAGPASRYLNFHPRSPGLRS